MEKYKICPSCQTKNDPTLFECLNCEADLTAVRVTDEETEKNCTQMKPVVGEVPYIRLCECGNKNPSNARKCTACGEDISDITPTTDTITEECQDELHFVLSSLDGKYAYEVVDKEIVIGRENIMNQYLAAKSFVSRAHATINIKENSLFITNLSNTNCTYVNNTKITTETELQDGDELGLGGMVINGNRQENAAYFLVRIGQCI